MGNRPGTPEGGRFAVQVVYMSTGAIPHHMANDPQPSLIIWHDRKSLYCDCNIVAILVPNPGGMKDLQREACRYLAKAAFQSGGAGLGDSNDNEFAAQPPGRSTPQVSPSRGSGGKFDRV